MVRISLTHWCTCSDVARIIFWVCLSNLRHEDVDTLKGLAKIMTMIKFASGCQLDANNGKPKHDTPAKPATLIPSICWGV